MPRARLLLRAWIDADRARFCVAHRPHRRLDHLRPLYRLDDRVDDRRECGDRAVLAGLETYRARGRGFPGRPVPRGQHRQPQIRGRTRRLASGLVDLRHVRLRLFVRLRRPSDRRAACRRNRGAVALRDTSVFRELVLYGRKADLMPSAPRQLALALEHAESFAREDFLSGASNAAALALVDGWPAWPDRTVMLTGPAGSGKSHLAAIWRERQARAWWRHTRWTRPACRGRSPRARWSWRNSPREHSTSAPCFTCSISRARSRPSCC